MNRDEVWHVIDEQRADLAGMLAELSESEWATGSLCTGWRVRDVAAHLTLAQMGPARATFEFARAGGGFDRMIRDTAIRQARLAVEELTSRLRAMVGSRRKAPGISPLEPLLDVLVHGQDIAIRLGRGRPMPPEAAATVATRAWEKSFPFRARRRLAHLRLVATDHTWSVGNGSRVEGPIAAILLLLTGRDAAALPHLDGPGLSKLRPRAATDRARQPRPE